MTGVEPTQEAWLPELSDFLRQGFAASPGAEYFAPTEVLRWKFFAPRGPWTQPRSFVVREQGVLQSHIAILPTTLVRTLGKAPEIPTIHTSDWLTGAQGGFQGALLMFESFAAAEVQYGFGGSPDASKVSLASGYKQLRQIPLFHKVRAPWRAGVWRELHGPFQPWPGTAMLALDLAQTGRGWLARPPHGITARPIPAFGTEPETVTAAFDQPLLYTSRCAGLLNHLLRHPAGCLSGWVLEQAGRVRGFALLSVLRRWGTCTARLADLFLDTADPRLWQAAIAALEPEAWRLGAGVLSAYGSTPWMEAALRQNGYFRRGRTAFYLRDPKRLVDSSGNVHLTHLEADLAYI